MKKRKRSSLAFMIESSLAILIAVCVVVLMGIHETREKEVNERYLETLLVSNEQLSIVDPQLKELITEYRPRPYKMIEIYDADLKLTFRIQFRGEVINARDDITNHPELIEYFRTHSEGHTYYTINNDETDVYFRWCKMDDQHEEQLVIIYTSRVQETSYWMHSLICYLILMLSFMIVIVGMLRRGREKVHQYQANQSNIFDSINR